jgi:hypothetical protein
LILVLALVSLTWAQEAQEEATTEKKIGRTDVPAAVIFAFEQAYPKAKIVGTAMETEDSVTFYEIESKEGKVNRDILYRADGTVKELEESLTKAQLPPAIKSALSSEYPEGKIQKAEKTTRDGAVFYEVHMKSGKDRMEVVLDDSGKILKTEKKTRGEEEDED